MTNDYEDVLCDFLGEETIDAYLHKIRHISILTPEEEKALWSEIALGNSEAINKMLIHNLRYVVKIAKHYQYFGLPLMDIIQEGNVGLIEALNHFDASQGYRFSTYATSRIMQKIKLAIANTSRNIRIPIHAFDKLIKYKQTKDALFRKLNRIPNREELAKALKTDVKTIAKYEEIEMDTLSLNYLISEEDNVEFGDFLATDSRSLEDAVIRATLPSEIKKLFEVLELDKIDIDILVKRYGLDGRGIRKYDEIAKDYNHSNTWVRGREIKTLAKIKRSKYFNDTFKR